MAARVDIVTYSDRAFVRRFVFQSGDPPVPIDLTGTSLLMKLRREADDTVAELVLTTANGGLPIEAGTAGAFRIVITKAQALLLPRRSYVHSLLWIRPDQDPFGIWDGTLLHKPGPSR